MSQISAFLDQWVSDDPEANAVMIVRATSVQFALCFFTSLTRTDANSALALLGLYAAFYRKKDPIKLYFIFLILSCLTDFIWMVIYGNQIDGMEQFALAGGDYGESNAHPPVGTCKFVLAMSALQFIVKILSVPFCYKLQMFLPDDEEFSVQPYDGEVAFGADPLVPADPVPSVAKRSSSSKSGGGAGASSSEGVYQSGYQGGHTSL